MAKNEPNTDWITDHTNDLQVRVHTTRHGKGRTIVYRVFGAVYVLGERGWVCPEGTVQIGTINKDTNLPTSQEWVSVRRDLPGMPASNGFHPTLGTARYRMGGALLSSARRARKA